MEKACPCTICNSHTHSTSRCPQLCEPLRNGFYTGGGDSGGGGDDESLVIPNYTSSPITPIIAVGSNLGLYRSIIV